MPGTLPVSGDIDPRNFPFLVTDLYRQNATGSLKVDGPSYQKDLYFRGGRILFGSSNDPRDQLGAILIEAGRLTPEQLEEVNSKVGPGNPLAKVLADSGLVTQQELTDAARLKVEQILGDVLAYREGSFEFEDGVLPKGAVDLKLHADRLVLAAVRRITDRAFVLGHIESLEVVLAPAAEASAEVTETAGQLLAEIDGQRTLKECIARTTLEEFDAGKVACALLFLGIVKRPAPSSAVSTVQGGEDSPFFVHEPSSAGSDLGAVARQAMGEPTEPPVAVSEGAPLPAAPIFEPPASEPPPPPPPPPPKVSTPIPRPLVAPPEPAPLPPSTALPPPEPLLVRSEEAADRPLYPHIEPPSQSDLAAINALLAAPIADPAARRAPAPRRSTATPHFGPPAQARRTPASDRGGRTVLGVTLVLVLLLAAGAAGWWYWLGPGAQRSGASVAAVRPAATPAPPRLATPDVAASPTTTAGLALSPPGTATPDLPSAPEVVPAATTPSVAAPNATGRALLRERRYVDAGRAFAAEARTQRSRYTIQVLVACSDETLDKTLQGVGGEEWFIVPVLFKGRACHRLCWGTYSTPSAAEDAQSRLPEYFRSGGAVPRVVPLATILP